jgi:asparagine N-glycosylation enzyme membrane subunit Stt3
MLDALFVAWSAATVILVLLLIYRALLSNKEEDRLFLDAGEAQLEQQQQVLIGRLQSINKYSVLFGILSGLLLLIMGGLWTYQQFTRPPIS